MVNANTSLVAMYILGKTESNNTWDSINYNDPITLGMMQWYGTRAAGLMGMLTQHWPSLHASIRTALETHAASSSYWPSRFLTADEGESIRPVLRSEDGKAAQQTLWESDYADNVATLEQYGFSEAERPQAMILLMSALHQSPKRAHTIARNYGGNSSLDRIYGAIRNEPVLSKYMTHRYTPTYNYLKSWDGASPPPEFGQVRGDYTPPGDDSPAPPPAEQPAPDNPADQVGITNIQMMGDHLYVTMKDGRRAAAYQQTIQNWQGVAGGTIVPPAPDVPPPDTPAPPEPDPSPGVWSHPCPARSRVSSEYGPRGGGTHRGIDMAAPLGTPLYAVAAGTVLRAGTATGFGGYIGILLDTGEAVGYGHMKPSSALVSTGDRVAKGQQISAVASEGQSSGPHLHFEVYSGGVLFSGHVNPRPVLESKGVTP